MKPLTDNEIKMIRDLLDCLEDKVDPPDDQDKSMIRHTIYDIILDERIPSGLSEFEDEKNKRKTRNIGDRIAELMKHCQDNGSYDPSEDWIADPEYRKISDVLGDAIGNICYLEVKLETLQEEIDDLRNGITDQTDGD